MAMLMLVSLPHSAQAADPVKGKLCEGRSTQVDVVQTLGSISEDVSLMTAADLTTPAGWDTSLVVHIESSPNLRAQNHYTPIKKDKESCLILDKTTIAYRIDLTLHISNTFPAGSCQYKQVQAHKDMHVAVARDFVQQSAPVLKNYMEQAMKGRAGKPYRIRSNDAQAELDETMNNILASYAKYLSSEHSKLQKQIVDNTVEMEKMYTGCPEWAPAAGQ